MTKQTEQEAIEQLRKMLKPGDTIYTITRHVSRSGMIRRISAFVVKNKKILGIDWQIAKTGLFSRRYPDEGLVVDGCGMDMHFHVVYELGRVLYPEGFKLPRNYYPRFGHDSTEGYESDGGYAFTKESL